MWWLQELNLSLMVSVNNIQDDLKKILYLFLFWEVLSVVHSCCQTFDLDWSKFILLATRENLTKQNWTNMNTVVQSVTGRRESQRCAIITVCLVTPHQAWHTCHLHLKSDHHRAMSVQLWGPVSVVSKLSSRMFVFNHIIKGTRIMFTS